MNEKQLEVKYLLVEIYTNLKLGDKKYINNIKEKFNVLDLPDEKWSEIEDYVLKIIEKLNDIR